MNDPLRTRVRKLARLKPWLSREPREKRAVAARAIKLMRAAESVACLTPREMAMIHGEVTGEESSRRRNIRASLGILCRYLRLYLQVVQAASGGALMRGPLMDGATWAFGAVGWPRVRPIVVDILAAYETEPEPSAEDVDSVLALMHEGCTHPYTPARLRAPPPRPVPWEYQDDPGAVAANTIGQAPVVTTYVVPPEG